jgi:hypothetical protein
MTGTEIEQYGTRFHHQPGNWALAQWLLEIRDYDPGYVSASRATGLSISYLYNVARTGRVFLLPKPWYTSALPFTSHVLLATLAPSRTDLIAAYDLVVHEGWDTTRIRRHFAEMRDRPRRGRGALPLVTCPTCGERFDHRNHRTPYDKT